MVKEEKPVFFRVFLIVFLLFLVSTGLYAHKLGVRFSFSNGLTGNSIKDVIVNAKDSLSPLSKGLIIAEWILLLLALFIVYFKDKGVKRNTNELTGVDFEKIQKHATTDIDTLYEILKQTKKIRISTIEKRFKISKELAMEWAGILESSNLGMIDYPGFGEPVLTLKEKHKKEDKDKEEKKDKNDETSIKNKKGGKKEVDEKEKENKQEDKTNKKESKKTKNKQDKNQKKTKQKSKKRASRKSKK